MRKILPIGLIVVMPLLTAGQNNPFINAGSYNPPTDSTFIPGGNVSGVWTAENSPYIVSGSITVPAGDSLIIQPGVTVQFGNQCDLIVNGVLYIQGIQNQRVTLSHPVGTSYLDAVLSQRIFTIEFADISGFTEVKIGSEPVSFSNSSIIGHVKAYSISDGSIIQNCTISHSSGSLSGCSLDGGGSVNCLVIGNTIYENNSFSIEILSASSTGIKNINGIISNNNVTVSASNSDGEAYVTGIVNCSGEISFNTINPNAAGQYSEDRGIKSCSGEVHHNIIQKEWNSNGYCISYVGGNIYNNTMSCISEGISYCTGTAQNNIIMNCQTALNGIFTSQYNCIFNCPTPYSGGVSQGIGDIFVDPQLAGYYLSPTSPCIDAGNPDAFYIDPDSTRDDMGANFFDQRHYSPENLYIQMVGNDVVLEWTADVFADAYRVYRSDNPYSFGTQYLAEVTGTTYTDVGAVGENYFYKVVSVHW